VPTHSREQAYEKVESRCEIDRGMILEMLIDWQYAKKLALEQGLTIALFAHFWDSD